MLLGSECDVGDERLDETDERFKINVVIFYIKIYTCDFPNLIKHFKSILYAYDTNVLKREIDYG